MGVEDQRTTTEEHLRQVRGSFAAAPDQRLGQVMQAAVRHLHAFVDEVGLTRQEWAAGIAFLTAVGQRCDDVRQEFILLSDILGVSMLVEMINSGVAAGASEATVLGPFHVPGTPVLAYGESIVFDPQTGGEPLVLSGTIRDLEGRPIPGATVEVWQVQPNGLYDIEEDPARRNLRATFVTGDDGAYRFATVRPVDYTIPHDGPVGALLRAAGRQPWRPAHIHFRVEADGYERLVTHLFDQESPWLDGDVVFGVRRSLVAPLGAPECSADLVLEPVRGGGDGRERG